MELGFQDDLGSPAEADDILRSLLVDELPDGTLGLPCDHDGPAGDGNALAVPGAGAAGATGALDTFAPDLWQLEAAGGPAAPLPHHAPQPQQLPMPAVQRQPQPQLQLQHQQQSQFLLHQTQAQADAELRRRNADVLAWLAAAESVGGMAAPPELPSFPQTELGLLVGGMQDPSTALYGSGVVAMGMGAGSLDRRISNTSAGGTAAPPAAHPHGQQVMVPMAVSPTATTAVGHGGAAQVSASSAGQVLAPVEPMFLSQLTAAAAARPSLSYSGHLPQQLQVAQLQQQQQAMPQAQSATASAVRAAGLLASVAQPAVAAMHVRSSAAISGAGGAPNQQSGGATGRAPGGQDDKLFAEIEAMPFPRYPHRHHLQHAASTYVAAYGKATRETAAGQAAGSALRVSVPTAADLEAAWRGPNPEAQSCVAASTRGATRRITASVWPTGAVPAGSASVDAAGAATSAELETGERAGQHRTPGVGKSGTVPLDEAAPPEPSYKGSLVPPAVPGAQPQERLGLTGSQRRQQQQQQQPANESMQQRLQALARASAAAAVVTHAQAQAQGLEQAADQHQLLDSKQSLSALLQSGSWQAGAAPPGWALATEPMMWAHRDGSFAAAAGGLLGGLGGGSAAATAAGAAAGLSAPALALSAPVTLQDLHSMCDMSMLGGPDERGGASRFGAAGREGDGGAAGGEGGASLMSMTAASFDMIGDAAETCTNADTIMRTVSFSVRHGGSKGSSSMATGSSTGSGDRAAAASARLAAAAAVVSARPPGSAGAAAEAAAPRRSEEPARHSPTAAAPAAVAAGGAAAPLTAANAVTADVKAAGAKRSMAQSSGVTGASQDAGGTRGARSSEPRQQSMPPGGSERMPSRTPSDAARMLQLAPEGAEEDSDGNKATTVTGEGQSAAPEQQLQGAAGRRRGALVSRRGRRPSAHEGGESDHHDEDGDDEGDGQAEGERQRKAQLQQGSEAGDGLQSRDPAAQGPAQGADQGAELDAQLQRELMPVRWSLRSRTRPPRNAMQKSASGAAAAAKEMNEKPKRAQPAKAPAKAPKGKRSGAKVQSEARSRSSTISSDSSSERSIETESEGGSESPSSDGGGGTRGGRGGAHAGRGGARGARGGARGARGGGRAGRGARAAVDKTGSSGSGSGSDADTESDAGDGAAAGPAGAAAAPRRGRPVTYEDMRAVFHLRVVEAARALGFSATELKRRCRALGFSRWPQRKLLSLQRMADSAAADKRLSQEQKQAMLAALERNRVAILANPDTPLEDGIKIARQVQYKALHNNRTKGGGAAGAKGATGTDGDAAGDTE